jgi:hypothetical protein
VTTFPQVPEVCGWGWPYYPAASADESLTVITCEPVGRLRSTRWWSCDAGGREVTVAARQQHAGGAGEFGAGWA